jgi:hypothetical protein
LILVESILGQVGTRRILGAASVEIGGVLEKATTPLWLMLTLPLLLALAYWESRALKRLRPPQVRKSSTPERETTNATSDVVPAEPSIQRRSQGVRFSPIKLIGISFVVVAIAFIVFIAKKNTDNESRAQASDLKKGELTAKPLLTPYDSDGGKWGYHDGAGKVVIAPQFDFAADFREGLAMVGKGGKLGFINCKGAWIIPPDFDDATSFFEGVAAVKAHGKYGYIDKQGKTVITPQFDAAMGFSEGLAPVRRGDVWGYIDKQGEIVITPQFDVAMRFSEGLASVRRGDVWGYVDKTGHFRRSR